ncbi:MAG: glycosyltransferase family A protein [Caldilineaceae bacterium]
MKCSVIIPAFKQAEYLGQAIESVLQQTYTDLECVVVNDCSPDHTEEVVKRYNDPRVIYIKHEQNQGLPATRNTGIRGSSGELIFLLDCDDYFHPEKLQYHVRYLQKHPEIGVTYNPRFELYYSGETINGLVRPRMTVELRDLVLGFPFSPSDMVLRREWYDKVGGFDGSLRNYSEDLDINCKLALAGCKFASVNKTLNYRRLHTARPLRIAARLEAALQVLERIFADPHCPNAIRSLRDHAYRLNYIVWGDLALLQNETELGHFYLRNALRHEPTILQGRPSEMAQYFAWSASCDDNFDHVDLLKLYFDRMPPEYASLKEEFNWAAGRGAMLKGIRALMWNRPEEGRRHWQEALRWQPEIDEAFLRKIADDLFNYEFEFGAERAQEVWQLIQSAFTVFGPKITRQLRSIYYVNRGFKSLHNGQMKVARRMTLDAIVNQPRYLANRGVMAMLLRSIVGIRPPFEAKYMQVVGE